MPLKLILLISLLFSSQVSAQLTNKQASAIQDFHEFFAPEFKQDGITFLLEIEDLPLRGLAWVWRSSKNSWIFLNKSLFSKNLPFRSEDALYGILCHELGHLRSPYLQLPDTFGPNLSIASEGEADYYETNSCLKQIFQNTSLDWFPDQQSLSTPKEVKEYNYLQKICAETFLNIREQKICIRSSLAAYQALQNGRYDYLSDSEEKSLEEISFSTPSMEITQTIQEDHPADQCRLDTYLAGALNQPRPACWFR